MYQRLSEASVPKRMISLGIRNHGFRYARFSAISGAAIVHGKMWLRPTKIRSNSTNATGRNATYPSRNRITGLDHRAVVMRWTATNITPADEMLVKYSQLKRSERHALSGATNKPRMKTSAPTIASTAHSVRSRAGKGREVPARI